MEPVTFNAINFKKVYVTEPQKHIYFNYTVYKIVYQRFSENGTSEIIVFKRFKELKKLYEQLTSFHHFTDNTIVPALHKAEYLNRFNDNIIECRRKSAEEFLRFVCKNACYHNHQYFQSFLRTGLNNNLVESNYSKDVFYIEESKIFYQILSEFDSINMKIRKEMERINDNSFYEKFNHVKFKSESKKYLGEATFFTNKAITLELNSDWKSSIYHYEEGVNHFLQIIKNEKDEETKFVIYQQVQIFFIRLELMYYSYLKEKNIKSLKESIIKNFSYKEIKCDNYLLISNYVRPYSYLFYYKVIELIGLSIRVVDVRTKLNYIVKSMDNVNPHSINEFVADYSLLNLYQIIITDYRLYFVYPCSINGQFPLD